ncbi:MAG: cupin domain-containing protein [Deltaproteobacteria bacterium]|nr:cupin domain-containing protein [Deltaproteobacteria bacterium]
MVDIESPVKVDKPWGHEIIFAHTDRYVGKVLHIDRGCLLSRQYHEVKDETLYVLDGEVIVEIGPSETVERTRVKAGFGFRVVPGTIHRFIAPDDQDCDLLECSTSELDDVVRVEDVYGREGTSDP